MKKEDWEYIANNWGNPEESVLAKVAEIREADSLEQSNAAAELKKKEEEISKLQSQNIDLNKTNMNLILRLTEPGSNVGGNEEEEHKAASIYDLDAFVKEV